MAYPMFSTHPRSASDVPAGYSAATYDPYALMDADMDTDAGDASVGSRIADAQTTAIVSNQLNESNIKAYIVLDTNIFDHYLDLLQQFVHDVGQMHTLLPFTFIVPGIVINDDSIIDCCQYFKDRLRADVALWTEDNLLKFRTESHDQMIKILKCPAHIKESEWTCRATAHALGLPDALAEMFSDTKRGRQFSGQRHGFNASVAPGPGYVDRMDVDWVLSVHEKDWLHMDMIERLNEYLRELVETVAPLELTSPECDPAPGSISVHAQPWERRAFRDWTLCDCVQYLGASTSGLRWLDKAATDHLTHFLTPTSEDSGYPLGRGKSGSTWTTFQWQKAMQALRELERRAVQWDYEALTAYLRDVRDTAASYNLPLD
ncbi:hypothetical protein K488DRAFT_81781 [Vararia minispora EC-137]|uniref:Uncharacterized protein n=1 Tax=Vararia minispora EC-137 TaxID=1314806 RepID=A0ACB8QYB3_9AGAM|nr:hypothetical protein K488DRAFT_81781 [Vararia minispora EC-137]